MKRRHIMTSFSAALVLLSACESEHKNPGEGLLQLQLKADSKLLDVTRAEAPSTPDVGEFKVEVWKGENLQTAWDSFDQYPEEVFFPIGNYEIRSYYGSLEEEGFEKPYYLGKKEFIIRDSEATAVEVVCRLANIKVSVEYTDNFRNYFSDYALQLSSDLREPIIFDKEETRDAYLKPGRLDIVMDVVKQQGTSASLAIASIENTLPRQHYRLKFDVDAGSSSLNVSFSDETEEEAIQIDISEENLYVKPPFFTPGGFTNGEPISLLEGGTPSTLSALLTARGGIKTCMLRTVSPSLLELGWPAEVDLANPDSEVLERMTALGLKLTGLSANKDKMAVVDLSKVVSYIQYEEEGDNLSTFTLTATDKASKITQEALVLKIETLSNQFGVTPIEEVAIGATYLEIPVSLDGDVSRLRYQYLAYGAWQDIAPSAVNLVSTTGINHRIGISFENPFMSESSLRVICGSRAASIPVKLQAPVFSLSVSENNIWATKAQIQIESDNVYMVDYLKNKLSLQYALLGTEEWQTPQQGWNGSSVVISGLPQNATSGNQYCVRAVSVDGEVHTEATNQLVITPETALQIPNSDFETWSEKMVWKKTIFLSGGREIWSFYPYDSNETDTWWSTYNDMTTQAKGDASWYYCAFPGTVPTSKKDWTATNHLNNFDGKSFPINASSGSNAMEIATVGWGKNNWTGEDAAQGGCQFRTAGRLFIGTLDRGTQAETQGHAFASRPAFMAFDYKFYSYASESAAAEIVLENDQHQEIGRGHLEITPGMAQNAYTRVELPITYSATDKAAYIKVLFISSTAEAPATMATQGSLGAWNNGYGDSRHIGSILTVDNVQLIY